MKSPSTSLVNQLVVLTLALLVFGGTLGLGAVWARQGISQTANRSRAIEVKITDVERRLDEVNAEIATAMNVATLRAQNQTMGLALVAPREIQVVRVAESPELRLAAKRNSEIFSLGTASTDRALSGSTGSQQVTFRVVTAALR